MAKKLGLARVLGADSLASVAYGEIGSSIYFALGVVALYALGATPWVLLFVGALFLLVAVSYAEGTAAIPETGVGKKPLPMVVVRVRVDGLAHRCREDVAAVPPELSRRGPLALLLLAMLDK